MELHVSGGADAEHGQAIVQHLSAGRDQRQTRLLDDVARDKDALGVVLAVITGSQLAQVKSHVVRRKTAGGIG